jgi:hypothetical protein
VVNSTRRSHNAATRAPVHPAGRRGLTRSWRRPHRGVSVGRPSLPSRWKETIPMVVVLGIDVHKDSHTAVAVDAVGHEVGQRRVIGSCCEGRCAHSTAWSCGSRSRTAGMSVSTRLERALLAAGQQVVRVPPGRWPGHGLCRARVESPIRLTRWPPPGPCCASLTYRSLPMTGCHGRSSCWLITGRTWWPAAPGCRTRGAGTGPAKGERQDHDDLFHARGVRERTWRPIALASAT